MVLNKRVVYGDTSGIIKIPAKTEENHRLLDFYVDPSILSWGYSAIISVGTKEVAKIPLKTEHYNLIEKPNVNTLSIMSLVRRLFGADTFVEADPAEDIIIKVVDRAETGVNIEHKAVAYYEVFTEALDKTKLMRSGADNYVMFPYIYAEKSVSGDNASISETVALDKVLFLEGLPEIKDGSVVSGAVDWVSKMLVFDYYTDTTGTFTNGEAKLHMKDETFELFSPINYYGIRTGQFTTENASPLENIAAVDLEQGKYLSLEDYLFAGGHKVSLKADVSVNATGTGITTKCRPEMILACLLRKKV